MQAKSLKRSVIRIAGIAAIAAALLAPGGVAGAMSRESGLTACERDGCAIVTMHDLTVKRGSTEAPAQPFSPHGPIGFTE